MGKITKKELHPSLIEYISELINSGSRGTSLVQRKKSVTINSQTSEVNIGIPEFDKTSDILLVFKNSVHLEENVDYTIHESNSKIVSVNGNWNIHNKEMIFNFLVFKNIPESGSFYTKNITGTKTTNDLLSLIYDMKKEISELKLKINKLENK